MSDPSQPALELRNVTCGTDCHALRNVSLRIEPGALHLLTGKSAPARAAMLRVIGLLDAPESGEVILEARNVSELGETDRDEVRNQRCGFLFSAPFLLPSFSVVENVAMPLFKISRFTPEQARERTDMLLDFVGLTAEAQYPVEELTSLQQQAASLARALANAPAVVTVENLDATLGSEDAASFATLLRRCCARFGVAVVASVSPVFSFEPGDRLVEIDAAGIVRESTMAATPPA